MPRLASIAIAAFVATLLVLALGLGAWLSGPTSPAARTSRPEGAVPAAAEAPAPGTAGRRARPTSEPQRAATASREARRDGAARAAAAPADTALVRRSRALPQQPPPRAPEPEPTGVGTASHGTPPGPAPGGSAPPGSDDSVAPRPPAPTPTPDPAPPPAGVREGDEALAETIARQSLGEGASEKALRDRRDMARTLLPTLTPEARRRVEERFAEE